MCLPKGTECYKSLSVDYAKCLVPCKGLFADVERGPDVHQVSDRKPPDNALVHYKDIKTGFKKNNINTHKIAGIY